MFDKVCENRFQVIYIQILYLFTYFFVSLIQHV